MYFYSLKELDKYLKDTAMDNEVVPEVCLYTGYEFPVVKVCDVLRDYLLLTTALNETTSARIPRVYFISNSICKPYFALDLKAVGNYKSNTFIKKKLYHEYWEVDYKNSVTVYRPVLCIADMTMSCKEYISTDFIVSNLLQGGHMDGALREFSDEFYGYCINGSDQSNVDCILNKINVEGVNCEYLDGKIIHRECLPFIELNLQQAIRWFIDAIDFKIRPALLLEDSSAYLRPLFFRENDMTGKTLLIDYIVDSIPGELKLREDVYKTADVDEIWIYVKSTSTVKLYYKSDSGEYETREVHSDDIITSKVFPKFSFAFL